jgi:hypothetical protein
VFADEIEEEVEGPLVVLELDVEGGGQGYSRRV